MSLLASLHTTITTHSLPFVIVVFVWFSSGQIYLLIGSRMKIRHDSRVLRMRPLDLELGFLARRPKWWELAKQVFRTASARTYDLARGGGGGGDYHLSVPLGRVCLAMSDLKQTITSQSWWEHQARRANDKDEIGESYQYRLAGEGGAENIWFFERKR